MGLPLKKEVGPETNCGHKPFGNQPKLNASHTRAEGRTSIVHATHTE